MFRIQITPTADGHDLASIIELTKGADVAMPQILNYLQGLPSVYGAILVASTNAVQAAGLVTFTGAPTAAETVTIANVVFTARASGATGNEFNIGGSITLTAAALAAAINASTNLAGIVTATSNVGVVTITSVLSGKGGNGLALSESMSNTTVTAFANGAEGSTVSTFNLY